MLKIGPDKRAFCDVKAALHEQRLNYGESLREFVGCKFDYKGFCRDIDASDALNATEKTLARKLFNPARGMHAVAYRLRPLVAWRKEIWKALEGDNIKTFEHVLPPDAPFMKLWREAYGKALKEHAPYLKSYKPVKRERIGGEGAHTQEDEKPYPYNLPRVHVSDSPELDMLVHGVPPALYVTRGILQLPEEMLSSMLIHEASHVLEPVRANRSPETYNFLGHYGRFVTLSGNMRRKENEADELVGKLGDGHVMAQALSLPRDTVHARRDALVEEVKTQVTKIRAVAKIAYMHGVKLSPLEYHPGHGDGNARKPGLLLLGQLLKGFAKTANPMLDFVIGSAAKHDAVFGVAEKMVKTYQTVHPPAEDRKSRLHTIEWEKRVEQKRHNPLGLTK